MNFWFEMTRDPKDSVCIEQIGVDAFICTFCRHGKVRQEEADMQEATDLYQSLLDDGYIIVKKGE